MKININARYMIDFSLLLLIIVVGVPESLPSPSNLLVDISVKMYCYLGILPFQGDLETEILKC